MILNEMDGDSERVVISIVLSESCMIVLLFGRVDMFPGSIMQVSLCHANVFITTDCACGQVDHAGMMAQSRCET